ncbi:hypothetical protein EG327_003574 [Venturia inaequalis]|uniref:CFEM domain-containing protein n=1 Tax=Venturia inaequalis TaxID=5025 RepID=A0A8H3VGA7_VENIN|nr:hypothetical protein EG327_003574 [Venturia inaequalis]
MKFTSATVLLSLFSSAAYAVTIADLPTCSVSCFMTAVGATNCQLTDTACQCGSAKEAITASVTPCIMKSCTDAADQAKTLTVANALCAGVSSSSASGTSKATGTSTATKSASTGTATSSGAATATSNAASPMRAYEVMGAFGVVAAEEPLEDQQLNDEKVLKKRKMRGECDAVRQLLGDCVEGKKGRGMA